MIAKANKSRDELLEDIVATQEEHGARLSDIERVIEIISNSLKQLSVLSDIREELHDLRIGLIKPLVKAFIIMMVGGAIVSAVAITIGIGVNNFNVDSNGISFQKRHE